MELWGVYSFAKKTKTKQNNNKQTNTQKNQNTKTLQKNILLVSGSHKSLLTLQLHSVTPLTLEYSSEMSLVLWGIRQLGSKKPALVKGVPAHCIGIGTKWSLKTPSNPNYPMILWPRKEKKKVPFGDRKMCSSCTTDQTLCFSKADLDHDQSRFFSLLQCICYPVTESQAGSGWKGPQRIVWSNLLDQAGSFQSTGHKIVSRHSGISLVRESLQPLWATCSKHSKFLPRV